MLDRSCLSVGTGEDEKGARRCMSPRLPIFAKNKGTKVDHPPRSFPPPHFTVPPDCLTIAQTFLTSEPIGNGSELSYPRLNHLSDPVV